MSKYLDPKADLTFKKVFGEYENLTISFLNALLPLEKGKEIKTIKYLPPELVPENPLRKNSIVDVRCTDQDGRQFIVEMQMIWSDEFKQRVLFNASKAYVKQLGKSKRYELLQPVYSLNLVNEIFEKKSENFYYNYHFVCDEDTNLVIDGLHLTFVELPKFKPQTLVDKKMMVLWLRFLTEIDEQTLEAAPELIADDNIKQALDLVEQSTFTEAQLEAYDKFWDAVRYENAKVFDVERNREEDIAEGEKKKALEIARNLKQYGMTIAEIIKMTGLSEEEIKSL
jgi:predicted transposase/invertase (TIGR01784 family)